MFSVNLDEALGTRRSGRLSKAYQLLHVSPDLCHRLTWPLLNLLRAMREHAKELGTAPNLAPLDPENFHSSRGRRAALINDLISRDAVYYDLNTCLREAAVLLKSFRPVLPASQLPRFIDGLRNCSFPPPPFSPLVPRYLAHRRMAVLKGQ